MNLDNFLPPKLPENIIFSNLNGHSEINLPPSIETNIENEITELLIDKMKVFSPRSNKNALLSPCNKKARFDDFQSLSRNSIGSAWSSTFAAYSPTTETTVNPLKISEGNLKTALEVSDSYIDIVVWVVNMSEQFFYDNTLLLLNSTKKDNNQMKNILKYNRQDLSSSYFEKFEDITLLGKGAYGKVYRGKDPKTLKVYAIKYISAQSEDFLDHCKQILNYITERDSVIRAMSSPFVVKFYHSLQLSYVGGLFLFFEYCIGELYSYISNITVEDYSDISRRLEKNEFELIQNLDGEVNVLNVSLMYIFEIFCGLDFLVQSNIIHQDIKPDNLMISETLHLKIGDFGLVYRTRTIHRKTNKLLVRHSDLDKVESSNYKANVEGTQYYKDFEVNLLQMDWEAHPLFDEIKKNRKLFDAPGINFDEETFKPTFLTDTWSAGIVSINLLFRGFDIFDPDLIDGDTLSEIPHSSHEEFLVHLVGRQKFYQSYIYQGLINAGGSAYRELMEFLASIFRPRKIRSENYVKEKIIYKFTRKRVVKHIELELLENMECFKTKDFNRHNVFLFKVPDTIREFFISTPKPVFPTFKHLLKKLSKKSSGKSAVQVTPGLTVNFFD